MEYKFRIGDILYCKRVCIMECGGRKTTTIGKSYTIQRVGWNTPNEFMIIDDCGHEHFFREHANEYFCTEKEYRKIKLKKLNNVG